MRGCISKLSDKVTLTIIFTTHKKNQAVIGFFHMEVGDGVLRVRRGQVQLALEWLCEHSPA